MSDVIRLAPERLRYKLEDVSDVQVPVWPGDWDVTRRLPLAECAKHRSIVQHYRDGVPWAETALFREIYRPRLQRGVAVRGCATWPALVRQYETRVEALYASLHAQGFTDQCEKLPHVYLARDGEVLLGNDGNHRVAMAKVLGLPSVTVRVKARHPQAPPAGMPVRLDPVLPAGAAEIPAMTTRAERLAGYELAVAHASRGAVVELGAWLGAATVYLAAGVRDAGRRRRVHVYDRCVWRPDHAAKAGGPLARPLIEQFRENLGPLAEYVVLHAGEFRDATWSGAPIGALVADGPKRVREIREVFATFGGALQPGTCTAWQDFGYFPAYDLPACFARLEEAGAVQFVRGVDPGTMAIFRVIRPITADDVAEARLRLEDWTAAEIEMWWDRWAERLPASLRPRFLCGAALFLVDQGAVARGRARFEAALALDREDAIVDKWRALRASRPAFIARYRALDAVVEA